MHSWAEWTESLVAGRFYLWKLQFQKAQPNEMKTPHVETSGSTSTKLKRQPRDPGQTLPPVGNQRTR